MRQTKKGNQWYFGMKFTWAATPKVLVHTLVTTDAAQTDIKQLPDLIHGEEKEVFGDAAYRSKRSRHSFQTAGVRYRMNRRRRRNAPLSDRAKQINREYSRVRSRVEHAFHVVKLPWGFQHGPVPGAGKEQRPCLYGLRAGEPLLGQTKTYGKRRRSVSRSGQIAAFRRACSKIHIRFGQDRTCSDPP